MLSDFVASDVGLAVIVYAALAMLGACLGSFSSAITYRVLRDESWISQCNPRTGLKEPARSHCPQCGHQLSFLDLIPFFSWVLSGGACRYCGGKISVRYLLLEVAGAALLPVFFKWNGLGDWALLLFVVSLPFFFSFWGVVRQHRRPPLYLWLGLLGVGGLVLAILKTL